jgi:mutator protein MutT
VHRVAVAALVRDSYVLLVHRHPQRDSYPDCWDLVGGHLEAGESPEDAVRRECREEIGVEVVDPRPIRIAISDPWLEMHSFLVTQWVGDPTNCAPEEHDDLRWFRTDELADLVVADAASLPDIIRAINSA